jgi:hypothetical protein
VPIFTEEYVNSGALLKDGQEVVLNAFLTESEANVKSTSPLGRLIPFLGSSKKKRKRKNLLFIAIEAQEIVASSLQAKNETFNLPHIDLNTKKNIFAEQQKKLAKKDLGSDMDIAQVNNSKLREANVVVDPLELKEGL